MTDTPDQYAYDSTEDDIQPTAATVKALFATSAANWHCYDIMVASQNGLLIGPASPDIDPPGRFALMMLKEPVYSLLKPIDLVGDISMQIVESLLTLAERLHEMAEQIGKVKPESIDLDKPQVYVSRDVKTGEIIESSLILPAITERALAYESIMNETTNTAPEPLDDHPELAERVRELREVIDGPEFPNPDTSD